MYFKSCISIFVAVFACSGIAQAKLNVFVCEPEWGSLARELGGDDVTVYVATTAFQDPHRIEARPSLIAKMRRADLVVCSGADLEVGWLPLLLRSSANSKVQPGQPGYFEAAMQVERLGVPATLDRSQGDVHAQGNPHVHLDPRRLLTITDELTERLATIDPDNATSYQQRGKQFQSRLQSATQKWEAHKEKLQGVRVVVHHTDFAYLLDWLGMKRAAALEPKPGVPPSTSHLAKLLKELQAKPAKLVIYTAYQDNRSAKWLSERANIPAVQLPFTVGGSEQATDLIALIDHTLQLLVKAVQ
ncbi:MAG: zinc ABC transporter substrate-binding protein [Gammaproteobacteria bacterium]|jgi:zinc/manganese transport system substrate-binding protein